MSKWWWKADYIETCNCAHGCSCNLTMIPTDGTCQGIEAWKIRGGEPFDASYVQKFIDQTQDLLPAGQWNIVRHVTLDDSGKTVDVTIRYEPKDR